MAAITTAVVGTGLAIKGSRDQKKASKKALQSQEKQVSENRDFISKSQTQARADVQRIFPEAQQQRQLGFQGALDVFGETIPQQLGVFQQGNLAAQQALLGGLPQIQNAILGRPVDFSQFQPQQLRFDSSFAQQQLPDFQALQAPVAPPQTPEPNIGVDPGNLLGGGSINLGRGPAIQRFFGQGGGRFANRTIRGL